MISTLQGHPGAASALGREFGDTYLYFFITDTLPTYNNGNTYRSIGNELLSRGMTRSAIVHYRMALQYKPGDAGIRGDLDNALALAERQKKAAAPPAETNNPPAQSTREAQSEK